jgi:hypothetical protein
LVAKSFVDTSRGYIPIILANITNHEQIMKQFTCYLMTQGAQQGKLK